MPLDERVLRVVERGRLLQDLVGNGELADVVQQSSGCELAQARGRQTQLLPHADCQQGDTPGVALGVLVLLREQPDEPADLGAEERLLGRDELRAAKVAGERSGRRRAKEVRRDRGADEEHARDLEAVTQPPREIQVAQHQRGHERAGQPDEADEDGEIRAPPRQRHGVQRAQGEQSVEREPDDEHGDRGQAGGLRHRRHEARQPERHEAERDDADHQHSLKHEQGPHGPRARGRGQSARARG